MKNLDETWFSCVQGICYIRCNIPYVLILFQLDTVGQDVTEFIYDVVPQLDPWQPGNFTLTPCAFNRDVIMAQEGLSFLSFFFTVMRKTIFLP